MAVGTALCGAPKVLACFDDGSAKRDFFRFTLTLLGSILAYPT